MSKTLPIVRMNEVPNGANMISELLGERERFPHKTAAPLADRVIQSFNQARFPTGFVDCFVPCRWKDTGIDLVEVSEADGALAVFGW